MPFEIQHCLSSTGTKLRYGISSPRNARGHIFILQGRAEFIERYSETARDLAARQIGCVAFDFRGQGGSVRETTISEMGYVADIAHYVEDAHTVADYVRARHDIDCPMLMTHSTGGLVGINLLLAAPKQFSSSLMIAPFFGLSGPDWMVRLAKVISASLCKAGMDKKYLPGQKMLSPLQPFHPENLLTSDQGRYERSFALLHQQPDLIVGGVSAGWLNACFRAQALLDFQLAEAAGKASQKNGKALTPTTMILSGDDRVVSNVATKRLFASHPDVTLHEVAGSRHEILQERDDLRGQFWDIFDNHIHHHHANWFGLANQQDMAEAQVAS
ncbi:alpha/beta fold hydrolase [Thalassospira marina]|uniref:Lysophospholipase n=1 Tax=Thalassospira marina TaxID=2048283 RepID=A0A2N3KXH3_9PROT|nr:alpha/beta hydrolase [Thalassospira marina]PKR55238.1 lysophospholipase [Thalassospira marina]